MAHEGKETGTIFRSGDRVDNSGNSLNSAVRKAMADHQRLLQGPQARTARQGGRYAQGLGGRRVTTLQDGTIITTWVNPFGLRPTLKASVTVPGIEEEVVEEQLIRGLIGQPQARGGGGESFNYGWGIPFTDENRPLGTPLIRGWDVCVDGNPTFFGIPLGEGTENPKRETILPSSGMESYLSNSRGLGGFDGMLYENINWIGTMPDDYGPESSEPPDVIVLSWKSYAGRYAEIPPSAGELFYRGDALCSLPPAENAITYLGAAVAEHEGNKWLVVAISAVVSERKLVVEAFNWPEMWSIYRFGKPISACDPDLSIPHLHYPIQFWRRAWRETYPNNDAYDAEDNPSGWIHIEDVECQSYTTDNYVRAYETTRPLAGVYFSSDGLKAACTFVDEWTDAFAVGKKNVHNITGHLVWAVGLETIAQTAEHVNPERGTSYDWDRDIRSFSNFGDYANACIIGPPWDGVSTDCNNVFTQADSRSASVSAQQISGTEIRYGPKIVAVDFDADGTLVTATISTPGGSTDDSFSFSNTSTSHNQSLTEDLICGSGGTGGKIVLAQQQTDAWSQVQLTRSRGYEEYTFTLSGASGFSLKFYEKKAGRELSRSQSGNWTESKDFSDQAPWTDCDGEQVGSGTGSVTVSGSRSESLTERIWDTYGTGSFQAVSFYHLDLRSGTAGYMRYDRDRAIIDTTRASGGWSGSSWSGSKTTARQYTNHALVYLEVIERGVTTVLASGAVEDLTPDAGSSSTAYWDPGNWTLEGDNDTGHIDVDNSPPTTTDGWPIESRPGIRGFFPVSAYAPAVIDWVIEGVHTDWGTADEWGNLLVGFENPHIEAVNSELVDATYWLNDIFTPGNITHLSGTDFRPIFDIESYTDQSVTQIGLI